MTQHNEFDLAVVGTGGAAMSAAIHARLEGASVVAIESGTLGGTCVNVGCVPSKTLLAAAHTRHAALTNPFPGAATSAGAVDLGALVQQKDVSGLFIAIGHDPRSALVAGQVDLDDDGYVKVSHPTTRTNVEGVFACGDLVDKRYRQAITAAGSGCSAALDVEHFLAGVSEALPAPAAVAASRS
ncbi:MAG: FAD-dependent oxidoreductase [Actinobacteria bacterium]|nr:FAD-dependent oxidoreductase [Actinomycetota bacterium]